MHVLSDDDLTKLDAALDNEISQFKVLSLPRDRALISLFAVFEEYINGLYSNSGKYKYLAGTQRKLYLSLDYCLQWIHRFTDDASRGGTVTEQDQAAAFEMLMGGVEYSDLAAQMSLAFRGSTKIRQIGSTHFEVSPGSMTQQEQDVGRMIICHADDPKDPESADILNTEDVSNLQHQIKVIRKYPKFEYKVNKSGYRHVIECVARHDQFRWVMNPGWDLGGYTFDAVRKFWTALRTMYVVHTIACDIQNYVGARTLRRIMIKSKKEWIDSLSTLAGTDWKTAEAILQDLVYDYSLYSLSGKPKPHVMYTPFFRLRNGHLALAGKVALLSSAERNTWALVAVLRPDIIDRLKDEKEIHWIDGLKKTYEPSASNVLTISSSRVTEKRDRLILS